MLTEATAVVATLALMLTFGYHIIIFLKSRPNLGKLMRSRRGSNVSDPASITVLVPTKGEPLDLLAKVNRERASALISAKSCRGEILVISDDDRDYVEQLNSQLKDLIAKEVVRIIRREKPAGGRTGALDYGAKMARGDYVVILDADSRMSAETLNNLCHELSVNRPPTVVVPWRGYSLIKNRIAEALEFNTDTVSFLLYRLRWAAGFFVFPLGSGTAIRRDVLEKVGYWGPGIIQDDIWLGTKLAQKGYEPTILVDGHTEVLVPSRLKSLRIQQSRWAYGASEIFSRTVRKLMRAPLKPGVKAEMMYYMLQPALSIILTIALGLALLSSIMEPGWWFLKAFYNPVILCSALVSESLFIAYALLHLLIGRTVKAVPDTSTLVQMGRAAALLGIMAPVMSFYSILGLLRIKLSYRITPKASAEENLKRDWLPAVLLLISLAGVLLSVINHNVVSGAILSLLLIVSAYSTLRFR